MSRLLCALFFLSGASALVFETLWFRQAGLAFGNSVWASSLVLAGFMGGLAAGNWIAARSGDRVHSPLRAYALLELLVGVTGIALVHLLPAVGVGLAPLLGPLVDRPWFLNPLRFVAALGLLLVPSTAMGLTLPLVTRALAAHERSFGRTLGRLYGWNTLGAVLGVVASELWLIGTFGIRGSALLAGLANLLVAGAALALARRIDEPPPETVAAPAAPIGAHRDWVPSLAAAAAGFNLLALEVLWFRALSLCVMELAASFAVMLGIVLAGIALGGLAAGAWLGRSAGAHRHAPAIAALAAVACVGSYALFPRLLPTTNAVVTSPAAILRIGLPLMLPCSFLSGLLFPLLGARLRERLASAAATTGALTFANTVGAALGAIVAGFVLLPMLGLERAMAGMAAAYVGIAVLLAGPRGLLRPLTGASVACALVATLLFPFGTLREQLLAPVLSRNLGPGDRLVELREGIGQTIAYTEHRYLGQPLHYQMLTNGYSMSATSANARRYMKLYVYLPAALHPRLERALLISYGVGMTARALADTPSLQHIDVVDISSDVLEMNRIVFPTPASSPLQDPRVRVHIEDGRWFLQTTQERYDLITGEPPPPQVAGVVNLYTREYFALIRARLAEGGMTTYWLPLHSLSEAAARSIIGGFCDVFDDCSLWHGTGKDLMLVGTRAASGPVTAEQFRQQWSDPRIAPELAALGFERPGQIGALFIGGPEFLRGLQADVPALVDDLPRLITAASRSREAEESLAAALDDAGAARERFLASDFIRQLWPRELHSESLDFFPAQMVINWLATRPGLGVALQDVDWALQQTDLRALPLWLLSSNSDTLGVIDRVEGEGLRDPGVQYHLAARRLCERDLEGALPHLERAAASPELRSRARLLQLYALARSGRLEDARRLRAAWRPEMDAEGSAAAADLAWLSEALGL